MEAYGGVVNEQLAIINAVSATPEHVLAAIAADARTAAIHEDESANVAGISTDRRSSRIEATFPEAMGVDSKVWDERVTGKRIGVAVVDTGIARESWNVPRGGPLRCPG
ncbi:MAG: hypothetical protein R3D55_11435 [Chloroflexota bacterium]